MTVTELDPMISEGESNRKGKMVRSTLYAPDPPSLTFDVRDGPTVESPEEVKTLRQWRAERLTGIKSLAAITRSSTRTIQSIERGEGLPRFTTMKKISQALGVKPHQITEFKNAIRRYADGEASPRDRDP